MLAADFKTAYPAFATVQNDVITRHIADAAPRFDVSRWEDLYDQGLAAYVAHTIAIEQAEQAAGVSLSVDAISYGAPGGQITRSTMAVERAVLNEYSRTPYGRRYQRLQRLVGMGAIAT